MRTIPLIAGVVLVLAAGAPAPARAGQAPAAVPAQEAPAPAPPPPLAPTPLPDQDPVAAQLWAAWAAPAAHLADRVSRVHQVGLDLGMTSLEAPARALLLDASAGSAEERARAAVSLAPDLPAARAALAKILISRGDLRGGLDQLMSAIQAVPHQLDARLWTQATGLRILLGCCLGGALLFMVVASACALPRLVRDLSMVHGGVPASSRLAMAAVFLLLPAVFGEGVLGVGLACAALAFAYGNLAQRICLGIALAVAVAALHPLLVTAARAEVAAAGDPVAVAAWTAENELPDAVDLARVRRGADANLLAARALALREKREGKLAEAERRYRRLLAADASPDLMNNGAGVLLARGKTAAAIDLYARAAHEAPSATTLFNLSQAYGRAIRLDDQDRALSDAQALDPARVHELASTPGEGAANRVVDLPIPAADVIAVLDAPGAAVRLASELRRRVAPGLAGESPLTTGLAALASVGVGLGLALVLGRLGANDDTYGTIARLLQGAQGADSATRARELAELRARQARTERVERIGSLLLPGAAGILSLRPLLGLLTVGVFSLAASVVAYRGGVLPDPLALGLLPRLLWGPIVGVLGLAYVSLTGLALALGRKS